MALTEDKNRSIFAKFPIVTWIGALFCFLLFPALIINASLESILALRIENAKNKLFQQMDSSLEFLDTMSNDRKYFHQLLLKQFDKIDSSRNVLKEAKKRISLLKNKYPDIFKFIVWDKNGRIIKELNDQVGYKYIIKNLYKLFNEVAKHCRENYPGMPDSLPLVQKKLNLFRSYLGKFLVPEHLRQPFQHGKSGQFILADTPDNFPIFWFNCGQNITLFCAINKNGLNQNFGAIHASDLLNRSINKPDKLITSGIVALPEMEDFYPALNADCQSEMQVALAKFENSALPHLESRNYLFSFRMLSPFLRGFCYTAKEKGLIRISDVRGKLLAYCFKILALIGFLLYCLHLRHKSLFISIKWKLAFLFIYANGLPLLIIATIGSQFLQQTRLSLIGEVHENSKKVLMAIDSSYKTEKRRRADAITQKLKHFLESTKDKNPGQKEKAELEMIAKELEVEESYIFDKSGKALFSYSRNDKASSQTLLKVFAINALAFANRGYAKGFSNEIENKSGIEGTSRSMVDNLPAFIRDFNSLIGNINEYSFGVERKLVFSQILGNYNTRHFKSLLVFSWKREKAQMDFLRKRFSQLNNKVSTTKFSGTTASFGKLEGFIPESQKEKLIEILQKAFTLQVIKEKATDFNNVRYIPTAISGKNLTTSALSALYPVNKIEEKLSKLRFDMLLFVLLNIVITSGIAFMISKFFIKPVNVLGNAVEEIGGKNYHFKINIDSEDEFGKLGKVFNSTIESMAELEIGRVVQENLFPGNFLKEENVEIFAKTVTMTRLGGDYYDFFKLENNKVGVFMGDVAGHGIPAALIMAMAKASVLMKKAERNDPAALLQAIHKMLYSLKKSNFKRMMTCQYLHLNKANGAVSIANAGHCFPIVISKKGKEVKHHEIIGSPLGIRKRATYQNEEITLRDGDTLMLYSDGIVEAANAQGEIFGINRLSDLLKSVWSENLETYYESIFNEYCNWANVADDDLTIVLIRYKAVDNG